MAPALAGLDPRAYRILEKLHHRRGVIEHVVVGAAGVFTIRPNHQPGRFRLNRAGWLTYNGRKVGDVVGPSSVEVAEVRRRLRAAGVHSPVHGLVVLTGTRLPDGPIEMGTTTIVESADVASFIRRGRPRLDQSQVVRVAAAVRADTSDGMADPTEVRALS